MKKVNVFFIILVFIAGIQTLSFAQGKGNLRGVIKDGNGDVLPGAAVIVEGTTKGAASDLNGFYVLQGIPTGEVQIKVNYIGFSPVSIKLNIKEGETTIHDFVLKESSVGISDVVVSAVVGGQQRALNQQKMADNMMQVVSADQIGRFPDPNVADALKRLSGVTSNGSEVQLRGTPANFTNISVDGEQIMSSQEGGKRNEELDLIPSDILSSLEVQKTLLPSNDGDAIAGIINMRTATARSLKSKYSINIGSGYGSLRDKVNYNAKAGFSKRFFKTDKNPNGTLGIVANYSFINNHDGYDRLEAEAWEPSTITDVTSGEIISEETYVPTDFRYRYQNNETTRHGASMALDWAPTRNTKFILSSVYNFREVAGIRYRNRYRFRDNGDGYFLMEDGSIGSQRMRNISQVSDQNEKINNVNINLSGESTIGSWKLDGGLFYNKSKRVYTSANFGFETPSWREGKKVNGIRIPSGTIIGTMPSISTKYLTSQYIYTPDEDMGTEAPDAISRFNLYIDENGDNNTGGHNFTARMNASKNYFIGNNASILSFGIKGKYMNTYGNMPEDTYTYSFSSSDANNLTNLLYTENLSNSFLNNNLVFGMAPDLGKVKDYMSNSENSDDIYVNEYYSNINRDGFYYDAQENVTAGYIMNKIQFEKLMVLAGFRFEHTHVDYKANLIEPFYNSEVSEDEEEYFNDYTCTPVSESLGYNKILPNIQFKYNMKDKTIFRLAWTTGYSRPNVTDLVPKQSVSQDLERVTIGNADLKPAYANNLDFLFEQYFSNVGVLSGGFFYKNIDDFEYLSEGFIDDENSSYNGWELWQYKNGDAANVYGTEITLNSSLSFLPSFLKNLVFTSNYTYVHSKATTNIDRGATRLPGQAKNTGNVALAYSTDRFTVQTSMNYIGAYINSLGSSEDRDIWQDGRWQMDINGSVKLYKGLTFWLEMTNVLNSESYTYYGDKSRVYNLQFNGMKTRLGFSYNF